MPKHLGRGLLSSQFHKRCDRIQRIKEKMWFQLHLQRAQMRGRELPLQFQRTHGLALGSNLQLDHGSQPENEAVHQQFHAETIDAELAGPYGERAYFRMPLLCAKADTPKQE